MLEALDLPSLAIIAPELWLAAGAMALLMVGVFMGRNATTVVTGLAVALLVIAAISVLRIGETATGFRARSSIDPFAQFMKLLALIGSAVAIAMSINYMRREQFEKFEYPILVLLATTGMMLMISSASMITLYLGLELQSLALYVLRGAEPRFDPRLRSRPEIFCSRRACRRACCSTVLRLIYGFTGHITFAGIAEAIATGERSVGLVFGLVFILAGLAFKISAVPFHMWTPDVYEGAPTPVTAFFAAAPKVAAMALLVRVTMRGV